MRPFFSLCLAADIACKNKQVTLDFGRVVRVYADLCHEDVTLTQKCVLRLRHHKVTIGVSLYSGVGG